MRTIEGIKALHEQANKIVSVHSMKIVGAHHEENLPAKIPYIMMWQYWLGNNKPKKAFRLILNTFKKLLQNLKKIFIFY